MPFDSLVVLGQVGARACAHKPPVSEGSAQRAALRVSEERRLQKRQVGIQLLPRCVDSCLLRGRMRASSVHVRAASCPCGTDFLLMQAARQCLVAGAIVPLCQDSRRTPPTSWPGLGVLIEIAAATQPQLCGAALPSGISRRS